MDPSPFSQNAILRVLATLNDSAIVPAGKRGALLVLATTEGVQAVVATKLDDHWSFHAEADYSGGKVAAGVSVIASW